MDHLKRKWTISLILVLLLLVCLYALKQKLELTYIEIPNQNLSAKSPKDLMIKLLEKEEYFTGSIGYKYLGLDGNSIEIELTNFSTGDDSTTGKNVIIYANKNGDQWIVTAQKGRHRCRGLFSTSWTTNICG